mmetsp:Transcript_46196/g.76391  ORF Transcript_46196/g.76391 Transcript_46196/m.76391 type:complete len:116 (+) Transcript_46196:38-385(+)
MGKTRRWKGVHPTRASGTTAVRQLRDSWERRMVDRAERAAVQAAQHEMNEQIRNYKQGLRERRLAKEKKKEENKLKGQQYQVITNTSKLKKMNKKQLRLIRKMDTTAANTIKPTA